MATWEQLGDEQFVSMTTFRRDGTPVPTTVWVARDGDDLVVTTMDGTGKVKRLRRTPRVELVPSSRTGQVAAGETPVAAEGVVFDDGAGLDRLRSLLVEKYGLLARTMMLAQKVTGKEPKRVGIRLRRAA
ncbi:PPOX class F420-dependent oxidoreductase [Lapillicoccus jejuensis]|uniref:Pyridoxamine 5'-phosphate oxidase N-terminal domain-containing protein n=1 Tax=Lapillicoccus jejuensis TaxID=402171 RepID=A0A542E1R1_9MICO|nr:PPOX class F420-dependent oxidoreductase [Lapillicoccus jejuensis]TQJ09277.1 hypothetical protein FB458_2387 [Lapillicoccus jejuensis]